jgi:hypothetical protein
MAKARYVLIRLPIEINVVVSANGRLLGRPHVRHLGNEIAARYVRTANAHLSVAVVACVVVMALGCSGGDGPSSDDDESRATTTSRVEGSTSTAADDTTTTSADATTTTAAQQEFDSVEDEIVARYEGYWDARFAANSPPNPDDPGLREYATGDQLDHVIEETQANLDAGVEFRRPEDPTDFQEVRVVSVDGDRAVVQECVVNDTLVVRSDSDEVLNDSVATYNVRGDMRGVDGEWRLAGASQVQQWEGVAGCALAD